MYEAMIKMPFKQHPKIHVLGAPACFPPILREMTATKKASKTIPSDISRDPGRQPLGDLVFDGVRQIAVYDDRSALRFRRTEFIRSSERKSLPGMSDSGKKNPRNLEPIPEAL